MRFTQTQKQKVTAVATSHEFFSYYIFLSMDDTASSFSFSVGF